MLCFRKKALLGCVVTALLAGCATTQKIVIPSYTAPREYKKISEIESGGEMKEGVYLALAIDPEVKGQSVASEPKLPDLLVNGIKQGLTETNFITIYPIFDEAYVQLDIHVLSFEYVQTDNDIKADIQVSYTLVKGVSEYLNKTYSGRITRHSSQPALLPSRNQVLLDLTRDVSKKFVSDITPLKTNQLREFKSLPGALEYVLTYAKQGNFQSAISDMEEYTGSKDAGFYFNLAVLYEAQGSETKDMELFRKADLMYKKSMQTGGSSDELIVGTKAKFDNFYRLFKLTEKQRKANKQLTNELESTYGIGE
ncbi:MAG: hypothetical protein H7A00_08425 [Hahellaceae bacterium]|nr:hypothetical protein [Hahellaceae bacterium]